MSRFPRTALGCHAPGSAPIEGAQKMTTAVPRRPERHTMTQSR
jgi:hypothetical protein